MPRKQRFKPSRKPKPIPVVQAQEGAELERSSEPRIEAARNPASERPEPFAESRVPQRREDLEAG